MKVKDILAVLLVLAVLSLGFIYGDSLVEKYFDWGEKKILLNNTSENACLAVNGTYQYTGVYSNQRFCYIDNKKHDIYFDYDGTWRIADEH